jgi:hypothetical protein
MGLPVRLAFARLSRLHEFLRVLSWRRSQTVEISDVEVRASLHAADCGGAIAALREAGFGVDHGRFVDVSGKCPSFATFPAFHGRGVVPQRYSCQGHSGA